METIYITNNINDYEIEIDEDLNIDSSKECGDVITGSIKVYTVSVVRETRDSIVFDFEKLNKRNQERFEDLIINKILEV